MAHIDHSRKDCKTPWRCEIPPEVLHASDDLDRINALHDGWRNAKTEAGFFMVRALAEAGL